MLDLYYYRIQEQEWDGENYFFYLEHTKSFTPQQFFQHFTTVYDEWLDRHPNRLQFLFQPQPELVIEYLQELLSLLKKRYGYKSLNVEQTAEYVTEMEVIIDDTFDYVETLKHTGFQLKHFFEEGYVNLEYEYRMLADRKIRKRGKTSLVEKDRYVFRLKEVDNMVYFYPLTHAIRLSQDSFHAHLEDVRQQLMAEKGVKPIIGIDIANQLCDDYGYEPLRVNATLTCFHSPEKQNETGNELGIAHSCTGTINFEQDYPYRRDPDEDYLIEGDTLLLYRYFSCSQDKHNQPHLVQFDEKWYAYHEVRKGNYAPTLPQEELKVISITVEFFDDYSICYPEDDAYATHIQEAIANSLALEEPLKNYS